MILVYDYVGVILMHTVPPQQTVNVEYYCSFLEHNLPLSTEPTYHSAGQCSVAYSRSCGRFVQSVRLENALPYFPGLSPCDFNLIPKTKEPVHGIHFSTVLEILQAVDFSIRTINRTNAAKGILQLHWQ